MHYQLVPTTDGSHILVTHSLILYQVKTRPCKTDHVVESLFINGELGLFKITVSNPMLINKLTTIYLSDGKEIYATTKTFMSDELHGMIIREIRLYADHLL